MAEEIDFENGRNSNFEGLVTLTFDPAILHIVLHQSSTSTYVLEVCNGAVGTGTPRGLRGVGYGAHGVSVVSVTEFTGPT